MVGRRIIFVLGLVLLAQGVFGATGLDSLRQARVLFYQMLNMDTTGTGSMPATEVNQFLNFGIAQANEDMDGYQIWKQVEVSKGQRSYALDSVIQINACILISNDTLNN